MLDIMLGQKVITQEQYDAARAEVFDRSKVTTPAHGCAAAEFPTCARWWRRHRCRWTAWGRTPRPAAAC